MKPFDVAFNYLVLEDEGSKFTNDPRDPGGPTKWGVTLKTYAEFFNDPTASAETIEQMTAQAAKQIYTGLYWIPLRCEKISDLAFQVAIFDCGVLYGIGTTALLVQRALAQRGASIKLDGILGDKSIGLLNELLGGGAQDARETLMRSIHDLLLERIDAVIVANPKEEVYRHGWTLRADRILRLLTDDYLNKFKEEIFT